MRIANGTLVLVADGAKMLLFRNDGDADLPVLATVKHEEADNPPSHGQGTDTPGRTQSSIDGRRSSYGETDWHQQAEDLFAQHVAGVLEKAASRESGGVVVIAPPRALAELRKHYGREVKQRLLAEIGKDLVHHVTGDVAEAIAAHSP